jgi:hypothetical protein
VDNLNRRFFRKRQIGGAIRNQIRRKKTSAARRSASGNAATFMVPRSTGRNRRAYTRAAVGIRVIRMRISVLIRMLLRAHFCSIAAMIKMKKHGENVSKRLKKRDVSGAESVILYGAL